MSLQPRHLYALLEDGSHDGTDVTNLRLSIYHFDPAVSAPLFLSSNNGNGFFYDAAMTPVDRWPVVLDGRQGMTYGNAAMKVYNGDLYLASGHWRWAGDSLAFDQPTRSILLKMDGDTQEWTLIKEFPMGVVARAVQDFAIDALGNFYVLTHVPESNSFIQTTPHLQLWKLDPTGAVLWVDSVLSYDDFASCALDGDGILYYLDFGINGTDDDAFQYIRRYDTVNRHQLEDLTSLRSTNDYPDEPYYYTEENGDGFIQLGNKTIVMAVASAGGGPSQVAGARAESGQAWRSDTHDWYESLHINSESFVTSTAFPNNPATQHAYGYQDEGMCVSGDDAAFWVQSAVDAYVNKFDTITRQRISRRTMLSNTGYPQTYVHFVMAPGSAALFPGVARYDGATQTWFQRTG